MEPVRRPLSRQQQRQQALPPAGYDAVEEDKGYSDVWPMRSPNSARRYQAMTTEDVPTLSAGGKRYGTPQTPVPRRRSAPSPGHQQQHQYLLSAPDEDQDPRESTPPRGSGQRRLHWLVMVAIAMFTMLAGWVLLTLFSNWWQVTQDDWHYGRPRTYQTDVVVGHHDSATTPSHFLALNLNSHVEVIEFPGGDASKAKIYIGPTLIGPGQDLAVVTLTFKDVNGDGKPDMIVDVENSHFIFINDNGQFRPARPGEQVNP